VHPVGSGPSGLTVAGDLVQKGHKVRVFEALHELGGVLVYGIPEFRLPKQIIREQLGYKRGYIQANQNRQRTTRKGVFARGDIVTGSARVILAMGAGRRAAKSIAEYLSTGES
jgi:NADPH-dependent glutamate synthase beta subunit-like oxidoreductase